jgi:tellurite resistance protein
MSSVPEQAKLVRGLQAVTEDLFFGVAAAGRDDEDALTSLARRRSDIYENILRGESTVAVADYRPWMTGLAAAIAPIRPPLWMPMSDLVSSGMTLEGGVRGVRALFTTKPSEKKIEHVRQVGSFAVRILGSVLSADGELDADEFDLIAALVASLGLPREEERLLLDATPVTPAELEPPVDLDPKTARSLVDGAWLAAANDGIDPREDRALTTLASRLGVRPEDSESGRADARKSVDEQRDLGAAVIDAIRYVLIDEPDHTLLLGKLGVRLFLPRRHRLEPLSALHQRGTVTLANRYRLPRAGQDAVLAAAWLAALHTDPSAARRVPLLLRHEDIARDLRAEGTGAAVRERLDRIVEGQLQLAVLAVGASI